MPANTKTSTSSQNKKTKQNTNKSKKNYSRKNIKNQKVSENQNKIKKKAGAFVAKNVQSETLKANDMQTSVSQPKVEVKAVETVQINKPAETTVSESNDNSVRYVVLLLVVLAILIMGIRLSYLQQDRTQQSLSDETFVSDVSETVSQAETDKSVNNNVVSDVQPAESVITEEKQVIIGDAETIKTDETNKDNYTQGASEVSAVLNEILSDNSYPVLGNPEGKYIVVDFFDYSCQWCKKTNYMFDKYITDGKAPNVRLIAVPTPVMGDQSIAVAAYALASMKQNKFAEFHQALTHSGMTLSLDNLLKIAESVGLDVDKLNEDVDNIEIFNQLKKNRDLLSQLKAQGIPYLIVNGELHAGALVGENLRLVIEQSNQ